MLQIILSILIIVQFVEHSYAQSYSSAGSQCPGTPSVPSHIRVIAIPDPFFVGANSSIGTPNSGFLVDLLDVIQQRTGLTYTLTARPDLTFGDRNPNGSYDGSLIGALINNEADVTGPDQFILADQEKVVDFLIPYASQKLQILVNTQFGLSSAVQYVTLGTDTIELICKSKNTTVQNICANLKAGLPNSLVPDDPSGLAKVLSGNFAYIGGSPFFDQILPQNTGKVSVVGDIGSLFVSLAVQQGSPLREKFNVIFLQLAEDGTFQSLFNKYNVTA